MADERRAIETAQALLDAGRPAEALEALTPHLAANPDDTEALLVAAHANLSLGSADEVLRLAGHAATLAPDNAEAFRLLARGHMIRNRLRDGRAAARTAVELAPRSWASHFTRAQVDVLGREPSLQGLQSAKIAVELAPNEPSAHLVLASILGMDDDPMGAEEHYRAALRLDPQNRRAKEGLALQTYRRSGGREAAPAFTDLLASAPQSRTALYNLRLSVTPIVRRLGWLLFFLTLLELLCSAIGQFSHLDGVEPKIRWIILGVSVLALIALVVSIALLRHEVGHRFDRMAGGLLRADRLLGVWIGLLALTLLVGAAAAFVPGRAQTLTVVGAILVFGVASYVETERRKELRKERASL